MREFDPVAATLRENILAHWEATGFNTAEKSAAVTLDTNTRLVLQRTSALFEPLIGPLRPGALSGLDVLDIGCGFGAMSLLFAVLGARVTGVDPSVNRLDVATAVAQTHGLTARFAQGRIEQLVLGDGRYDLAVVNNSLCYLIEESTRRDALEETRRVLRPGGRLVLRDPNRANPRDQFSGLPLVQLLPPRAATTVSGWLGRPRSEVRLRGPRRMLGDLRRAGFTNARQLPVRPGRRAWMLRLVTGYLQVTAVTPGARDPVGGSADRR